tara:strand:+ start:3022 stop:5058 length:2037 start_codon:yes stop_codon:yes gene_type:complete
MSNCVIKCFYDTANNIKNKEYSTKIALSIGGSGTQFKWSTFTDNKKKCLSNLKELLQKSGAHGIDLDIENQYPTKKNSDGSYDYSGLIEIFRELKTNFTYTAVDGSTISYNKNKLYLSIAILVGTTQNKYYKGLLDVLEKEDDRASDPLFDKIYLMNYNGGAWIEGYYSGTCPDNKGLNVKGYWDIWIAWWLGLKDYTELYGDKKTYSFDNLEKTQYVATPQKFNDITSKLYSPKRLFLGIITAQSPINKSNPYNYDYKNIADYITKYKLGGYFVWWYSTDYDTNYLKSSLQALSNINTVAPNPSPVCISNSSSSSCNSKKDEHLYFQLKNDTNISFTFRIGQTSKNVNIVGSKYKDNKLYLVTGSNSGNTNTLANLLDSNLNISDNSYHTYSNPISFEFDSADDAAVIGLVKDNLESTNDASVIGLVKYNLESTNDVCYYNYNDPTDRSIIGNSVQNNTYIKYNGKLFRSKYYAQIPDQLPDKTGISCQWDYLIEGNDCTNDCSNSITDCNGSCGVSKTSIVGNTKQQCTPSGDLLNTIKSCNEGKIIFSSPQEYGCFSIKIDSSYIKSDAKPPPQPPTGGVVPADPKLDNNTTSVLYTNVYNDFGPVGIPHVNYINLSSIVYDPAKDDFIEHLIKSGFLCKGDVPPPPEPSKCYTINDINIQSSNLNIKYNETSCK